MSQYRYIVFVYFNDMLPPIEFRVTEDTPLIDLKSKLEIFLYYTDIQKW